MFGVMALPVRVGYIIIGPKAGPPKSLMAAGGPPNIGSESIGEQIDKPAPPVRPKKGAIQLE